MIVVGLRIHKSVMRLFEVESCIYRLGAGRSEHRIKVFTAGEGSGSRILAEAVEF